MVPATGDAAKSALAATRAVPTYAPASLRALTSPANAVGEWHVCTVKAVSIPSSALVALATSAAAGASGTREAAARDALAREAHATLALTWSGNAGSAPDLVVRVPPGKRGLSIIIDVGGKRTGFELPHTHGASPPGSVRVDGTVREPGAALVVACPEAGFLVDVKHVSKPGRRRRGSADSHSSAATSAKLITGGGSGSGSKMRRALSQLLGRSRTSIAAEDDEQQDGDPSDLAEVNYYYTPVALAGPVVLLFPSARDAREAADILTGTAAARAILNAAELPLPQPLPPTPPPTRDSGVVHDPLPAAEAVGPRGTPTRPPRRPSLSLAPPLHLPTCPPPAHALPAVPVPCNMMSPTGAVLLSPGPGTPRTLVRNATPLVNRAHWTLARSSTPVLPNEMGRRGSDDSGCSTNVSGAGVESDKALDVAERVAVEEVVAAYAAGNSSDEEQPETRALARGEVAMWWA